VLAGFDFMEFYAIMSKLDLTAITGSDAKE